MNTSIFSELNNVRLELSCLFVQFAEVYRFGIFCVTLHNKKYLLKLLKLIRSILPKMTT